MLFVRRGHRFIRPHLGGGLTDSKLGSYPNQVDGFSDVRLLLRFYGSSVLLFCGSKLLTLFFNFSQDLQNRRTEEPTNIEL